MFENCTCSNNSESSTFTMEKMMEAMDRVKKMMAQAPPAIRIVTNPLLTERKQTKYPKKRKNIRWAKKYRKKYTITVPSSVDYYFRDQGILVCHPARERAIVEALNAGRDY